MLSRRNLFHAALGVGASLLSLTRVSAQTATQPATKRVIVDAQVHLWKAESPDWPWVPGAKPQLPEPMTIERLLPMMDEAGVDRVVVVPPSWPGDRNDYALDAAPLPCHGPRPAKKSSISRAAAEVAGTAGHARCSAHF